MRTRIREALVDVVQGDVERAISRAVTSALCGSWNHEGPCPLARHHVLGEQFGDRRRVRVLYVANPDEHERAQQLVDTAILRGRWRWPDASLAVWRADSVRADEVRIADLPHALRLRRAAGRP